VWGVQETQLAFWNLPWEGAKRNSMRLDSNVSFDVAVRTVAMATLTSTAVALQVYLFIFLECF
jgi:hypothetical protein